MAVDRTDLIDRIYYQELGRVDADEAGLNYWNSQSQLDDEELRNNIRYSAGLSGESIVAPLLADSTYASFLRNMELNESQIQSSLAAAQDAAARRIASRRPQYDTQREQGAERVNSSYTSRLNRSGKRLSDLNKNRLAIDTQQLNYEGGVADQRAQLERTAAQDIAALRRNNVSQQQAARERLTRASLGV